MTQQYFTTSLLVSESPLTVFNAINKVNKWWSEEIDGTTDELNAIFNYHYEDVHRCQMKIIELIPGEKVVWQVLDNYFNFTEDKEEWINDKIIFEITTVEDKTQLTFTHVGLSPAYECYDACYNGWTNYIQNSLKDLITTGQGKPNGKDKPQTENEKALSAKKN
ncbi:MAG: SRPBCC domain-containing protein [Chitinophagaceae bacterium]|nr:MAG: SRPBCC domain-containing protein [Chitinophagaceae bacterium]